MREKESRWTIQSGPEVRHLRKTDKKSLRGKDDERKRGIETKTVETVLKKREERKKKK